MAKLRKFKSLTTAELTRMKTALLTFFDTDGQVQGGLQSYTIAGRAVTRMSVVELSELLDDVSNEIAVRGLPDQDEIGIAGF
jgi:hypothetical protein